MSSRGKVYQYKDNTYKILHRAKMKIGEVWIHCVVYESEDRKVYVREQTEFYEKFKQIQK